MEIPQPIKFGSLIPRSLSVRKVNQLLYFSLSFRERTGLINVCVNIMKFFKGIAPAYSGAIFHPVSQGRATRRSKFKLELPFRKSNAGQKCLSYLGPKIWNSLPSELKSSNNINTFKHKIKENYFQSIQKEEDDMYVFY